MFEIGYGATIDFPVTYVFLIYLIVFSVYYVLTMKSRRAFVTKKVVINAFFILYLVFLLHFVWTPMRFFPEADRIEMLTRMYGRLPTLWDIANIHVTPFVTIIQEFSDPYAPIILAIRNIGGNFILLFPFAIFIGLLSGKTMTVKKSILVGLLISVSIEVSQIVINLMTGFPNRIVLFDDMMLNTLGFMLGCFVFKKFGKFFEAGTKPNLLQTKKSMFLSFSSKNTDFFHLDYEKRR